MDCPQCGNDPCTCAKPTSRPRYYRKCEHPGCTTMIGAYVGTKIDQPICKWCQAGEARYCRTCGPKAAEVIQRVIVLPGAIVGVLEACLKGIG